MNEKFLAINEITAAYFRQPERGAELLEQIRQIVTGEDEEKPRNGRRLVVPFLSQLGPGASKNLNDCGPASVAMVANAVGSKITVDRSTEICQQNRNKPTSISPLMTGMSSVGIKSDYVRPLKAERIKQEIDNGNPIVALVKYTHVPDRNKEFEHYEGSHYVVIVGYEDDMFEYHDPYHNGGGGAYLTMTENELDAAMSKFGQYENMPYQGIVCQIGGKRGL